MTQALIEVNGVAGTDNDVPIATLVQLSNADTGGELTYLWAILDQPEGAADALSSLVIENPTFTPNKEGSYLLSLVVNFGLPDEKRNRVIVAVREFVSNERIPAALETTEDSLTVGWKTAVNRMLKKHDTTFADANIVACLNASGAPIAAGTVVRFSSDGTIKTGLPGEERLLGVYPALATTTSHMRGQLGICVGTPAGGGSVASLGVALVRVLGLYENEVAGVPAVLDNVYVGDTGLPSLTPGTINRPIGRVMSVSGGNYRFMFEGNAFDEGGTLIVAGGAASAATAVLLASGVWGFTVASENIIIPVLLPVGRTVTSVIHRYNRGGAGSMIMLFESVVDGVQTTIDTVTDAASAAGWLNGASAALSTTIATATRYNIFVNGTVAANYYSHAIVAYR